MVFALNQSTYEFDKHIYSPEEDTTFFSFRHKLVPLLSTPLLFKPT